MSLQYTCTCRCLVLLLHKIPFLLFLFQSEVSKLEEELITLNEKKNFLSNKSERLKEQLKLLDSYSTNLVSTSKSADKEKVTSKDTIG